MNNKKECDKRYRLKHKEKIAISKKKYCSENKEKIAEYHKKYYLKNKKKITIKGKNYRLNNIDKIKLSQKRCSIKNKGKRKAYNLRCSSKKRRSYLYKLRVKNDILFRLNSNMSVCVRQSLNNINSLKRCGWEKDLGYTRVDLKNHLEKQFDKNMSWGNYGAYWELDHIVPKSWFKTNKQLIKHGWALKNLQPLESNLNQEKHNNFVGNRKPNYDTIFLEGVI